MKILNISVLCLLVAVVPACGQQLVEFPNETGVIDANMAGNSGSESDAGVRRDAPEAIAKDSSTSIDNGGAKDAGGLRQDAMIVDAFFPDALVLDAMNTDASSACRQDLVPLGNAAGFAVLAGATVTNTGPTSVIGDLGVSPGTSVTGFGPGAVVGTIHAGNTAAADAIASLTIAYNDAAGRKLCPVSVAGNLGGQRLAPGLYKSTSSLEITSGDLTLDAQGDANAVFIFQMATTLITTSDRKVILIGNARASNIFWQVGTSAVFGSDSVFHGTVMADQSITMSTRATLNGRVLARIAKVELDSNMIVKPAL